MNGKDDRKPGGELAQSTDRATEEIQVVHKRRAVQRDEPEGRRLHTESRPRRPGKRRRKVAKERVDHRVSDEMDARLLDPLVDEIGDSALGVSEQDPAQMVGETPIRL